MLKVAGIRRRWLINCVSVVLIIVLIGVGAFSVAIAGYYYSSMQSALVAKAKTATDFFGNYINQSYNEYYMGVYNFTKTFEEKNDLELQFVSARGSISVSSMGQIAGTTVSTPEVERAIETRAIAIWTGTDPDTGERIMAVSSPMIYNEGDVIGVMRFVTALRIVDNQIALAVLASGLFGFVVILFVLFSNLYFIRSIVDPVTVITDTAKRISAGSYGIQIEKKYNDEIGELADTINNLSMKISQSEKMQSEFISSVSHELRTPLTAIAGWGETLIAPGDLDPAETKRGVSIILREAYRLTKLVEDLLEFTRIQDGRFKLNITETDIQAEFEDTVFMYGSQLKRENIDLELLEGGEVPPIPCDGERMKQVFLNILDNAAKHGREGRKITAGIDLEGDEVVIKFRDFGPGVPEGELPHIKMRFYKGSSKERGSGIGLAVCDEIISMHNGVLDIENAEGGGALVIIRLPVKQ